MYKIVILGPPGSGKGTQAVKIAKELKIPHISTGEIFRSEMKKQTALGKKINDVMRAGKLVADEIVNKVVGDYINSTEAKKGFVLDGYPRKIEQAKFLDSVTDIDFAINLVVSDAVTTERLAARRHCKKCGAKYNLIFSKPQKDDLCDICEEKLIIRTDSQPEVIAERMKIYHQEIDPILNFYEKKDILISINGEPAIDLVWQEIKEKLKI